MARLGSVENVSGLFKFSILGCTCLHFAHINFSSLLLRFALGLDDEFSSNP